MNMHTRMALPEFAKTNKQAYIISADHPAVLAALWMCEKRRFNDATRFFLGDLSLSFSFKCTIWCEWVFNPLCEWPLDSAHFSHSIVHNAKRYCNNFHTKVGQWISNKQLLLWLFCLLFGQIVVYLARSNKFFLLLFFFWYTLSHVKIIVLISVDVMMFILHAFSAAVFYDDGVRMTLFIYFSSSSYFFLKMLLF